ncbi:hypothetical protein PACTADRAFT_63813 [Pachysolen tannophilus NRRL Y-2460]|uniref:aromatic-amino-acid transaminase n=1 Tax=Pachysolen tannophilus NRRL Y-2460 TaxID=669874 RepID=A0A1E4U2E5_PACTA|nr:hypothetical protein PACTADRAFT_63813 [Pachysolen tannophilus NRRL Y-2460]
MPQSKDFSYLLSEEAKRRNASPLKTAFKYFGLPDLVFLGGGLPLSDYFPWNEVSANSPAAPFSQGIAAKPENADDGTITKITKTDGTIPLSKSLQYGYTEGQIPLMEFVTEHTRIVHNVPYDDWKCIATIGNTQAWDGILRAFCDKGDSILAEEYTFPSSMEAASAQGVNIVPIDMDDFGIIPQALDEKLSTWEGKRPKLLYTIPTGQNPTGSSLSFERRKEILKIAQKYDFLIIEDEPYYFLQMEPYTEDLETRKKIGVHSHQEFLDSLVKSFISIDTEGRVLRLDSASKVLAPGVRFGWIVGQEKLLERLIRAHEVSIQAPSGFSQAIIHGTLSQWGQEGYLDWLIGLRHEYTEKRDVAIDTVAKNFPSEVTSFIPPVAGMFFTVKLDASKHPKFATEFEKDPLKVENAIYEMALEKGCLMIPGSWFSIKATSEQKDTHIFFRGTYAAVPLDKLVIGLERFGAAVKDSFQL